ncbi:MAG TPA: hypothetical protein VF483_11620, partial [Gemmatimonadaceae bacterium]
MTSRDADLGTYAITREDPGADWDAYVGRTFDGCYSQLSGWRTVLSDAMGHKTVHLVARDRDGVPSGALSMAWVRSAIAGRYLVSMPFLDVGGPIGAPEARAALASVAAEEARRGHADLLELRTRQPCDALATSHRKLAVCLSLAETSDAMWQRFPSKL